MSIYSFGRIGIEAVRGGVTIHYGGSPLTSGIGLNTGINYFGLWSDSGSPHWQVTPLLDGVELEVTFVDLPIRQSWTLRVADSGRITWDIVLHVDEAVHIDELKIVLVVPPKHKEWFSDRECGVLPQFRPQWQSPCAGTTAGKWAGVRLKRADAPLSAFAVFTPEGGFRPFVQMMPVERGAILFGFRRLFEGGGRDFARGSYPVFSGEIRLFDNEGPLDRELEAMRRRMLEQAGLKRQGKRCKKVLLVNMPWYREGKTGVRAGSRWPHLKDPSEDQYLPFPFFLAYAASLLQKHGFEAVPLDAIAEQLTEDAFFEKVSAFVPDLIVAEVSTPSFAHDLALCAEMASAGFPICLCGPHAGMYEKGFLEKHPFVDYVICGEYEFTLLDLCRRLDSGGGLDVVQGVLWRDGERVVKNPPRPLADIDLLPWPDRTHLPMERYWDLPGNIPSPSVQMTASRGCPFGCNFCLWPQVLYGGSAYRVRDVRDVVDEMEVMVRDHGFKSVYFDDDTFNVDRRRVLDFCALIRERGLSHIPWAIMARPDLMDREVLEAMKKAGLMAVKYGVESYNQSFVDGCGKKMRSDHSAEMIRLTRELGIKVHLTFTFGFPGETVETLDRNIEYALSFEPDSVQFSILTPFPGTKFFESLESQGRIMTYDWSQYDGHHSCVFRPDSVSPEDLERAKRKAYHRYLDMKCRKRGLLGDLGRFVHYLRERGPGFVIGKTVAYLSYIFLKRKRYLNGEA